MLPIEKEVRLFEDNFPTRWQTVIFRNYGFVPEDRIGKVLNCSKETVIFEAQRLGLGGVEYDEQWEKSGYITIIRNNWYILPYEQLVELLNITIEKLDFILRNEDFLGIKLGSIKPIVERVSYTPLTSEEIRKTENVRKTVEGYISSKLKPFDFFSNRAKSNKTDCKNCENTKRMMIHAYLTPCGDVFMRDSENYMPDWLLQEYANNGVNAIWVHGLLSALSPYPFAKSKSDDYKTRRYKLINLVNRCKKYGIKVYLYLNEPRGVDVEKHKKFSHLFGRVENGVATLCLENSEVEEYLYEAVKDLFTEVKDLGGAFTITMSENPTHCNYVPDGNCPTCKNIPPEVSSAKVNNIIARAIKDSGSSAELIANLWGWSQYMGWTDEQVLHGIDLLDQSISVLSVSEFDLDIEKGGVKNKIIDYSIPNAGPGEIAEKALSYAKKKGHKIYAKIQINNSWEMSAVPYLPVFDLTYEHIKNLKAIGVEDYLLNWTLGGYPSPTMDMISAFNRLGNQFDLDAWYEDYFGEKGKQVHEAVKLICDGFREYPFSVQNLYFSPKTLGTANLWDLEPSEKPSTMVCYSFDDYETWLGPYPIDVYFSQYEKLLKSWKQGVEKLKKLADNQLIDELLTYGEVAYYHFLSDVNQTRYSICKRNNKKEEMKPILLEEMKIAKETLRLLEKSSTIGFETSNHYFYTRRNLIEKLINVKRIENSIL